MSAPQEAAQAGGVRVETSHLLIAIAKKNGIPEMKKQEAISPEKIREAINEVQGNKVA